VNVETMRQLNVTDHLRGERVGVGCLENGHVFALQLVGFVVAVFGIRQIIGSFAQLSIRI
jgi:hypothetical protein